MATLSNNPTILPIAYFQPPSGYHIPTSSPKKKHRRCVEYSDDLNSSLMGFYASKDYYNSALQDYTSWYADKYGEHEFAEAFQQLQKHKVGVDLIEDTDLEILTRVCGISHGTCSIAMVPVNFTTQTCSCHEWQSNVFEH